MLDSIISWMESHMGTCSFHEHTQLACPGCGLQRALIALLKGDLAESLLLFPALIPLMVMFSFLGVHLFFKLRHGAIALKIMYITNASIILINFIVKLIIH